MQKKIICPFLLLGSPRRPSSSSGTLDFSSTYLRINSLRTKFTDQLLPLGED